MKTSSKLKVKPPIPKIVGIPRAPDLRPAVQHEDDDWFPRSPALAPTRAANEFFENDYDVM